MAGDMIIRQNSGEPLGKVESMAFSNSHVRGDVDGSTPAVPTLNASVKPISKKWVAEDMYGETVTLSSEGSNTFGHVKNVSSANDMASLSIDPILAKLNQQVTLQPTWGRGDAVFSAYLQQLFSACGITRWYMPGTTWISVEGSGGLPARFVQGDNFEQSGAIYPSATTSRSTTYSQGKEFSRLPMSPGSNARLNLIANVGNVTSTTEYRAFSVNNLAEPEEFQQDGKVQIQIGLTKLSARSIRVDLRSFVDGSSTALTSGSITLTNSQTDFPASAYVKVVVGVSVGGNLTMSAAVTSATGDVLAVQAGSGYSVPFNYSGSTTYSVLDKLTVFNGDCFYVTYGGDSFSVTNSTEMYLYSVNHGAGNANPLILPGVTDSGWKILNDLLLVSNYTFNTASNSFYHKSASNLVASVPGAYGVSVGADFGVTLDSRDVGRFADVYNYNYKRTSTSDNSVEKVWTAEDNYTISVGESREETITLPEGSHVVAVKSPTCVTPDTLIKYLNGNTGNSGYAVFNSGGYPITKAGWEGAGASITARPGKSSNEIILTLTGPPTILGGGGNDKIDSGTYTIAVAADGGKGIVLAGVGFTGDKKKVRTHTGASGSGIKDVAVEYDNVFVGSNDTLWNVAGKLALRYGSYESSVDISLAPKSKSDTAGETAKTVVPPALRIGTYGVNIGTYAVDSKGNINLRDCTLGMNYATVDDYYSGKTYAEVTALKSGTTLKSDAIFPIGKDVL